MKYKHEFFLIILHINLWLSLLRNKNLCPTLSVLLILQSVIVYYESLFIYLFIYTFNFLHFKL